ncbi:vitamin K-dependent gamma-carboxylase-like protein [Jejuia pallidilutea]|uniref:Vitamin K-dependent gamma-carboxylase-like protein n=1 Tax=Jejuia pallidilutea TaxID=504487 RepID=A0A362X4E7_9FLAO|nr:HTTM domain-containing protein [Jejuia pallidilutea]PQV51617.1 vitamin K-dependent gamma-carboxylase-like protein [Jejuia pallidilutea]
MLNKWLFKHIDNSQLVIFRIFFGLLCFLESFGAILTGWVKRALVEPKFTFTFIGFEWLQVFQGTGMYLYYGIMAVFGLLIMVGYKYRISMISFTLLWAGSYLMQKSSYNNHYYLLMLISAIMVFMPAHHDVSVDSKLNTSIKTNAMPNWCRVVFVLQLFIVYTYASLAKLYPDWLDGTVMKILMRSKQHYYLIGDILQQEWIQDILTWGGIFFDGLIVPLLLFKPTRKWAFIISIGFHLFNSIVFQIGIFPYLALAFYLFFFPPKTIRNIFLKSRAFYDGAEVKLPNFQNIYITLFSIYFVFQIVLPLRHHFFKGDVLWTEEGHRLSWRMMLRAKNGSVTYTVKDKATGTKTVVLLDDYLTKKQQRSASTKPDVIWQFSQYLKAEFKRNGQDVSVYVDCRISVNGKPLKTLVNPEVDIASVPWTPLHHSEWILPSKK